MATYKISCRGTSGEFTITARNLAAAKEAGIRFFGALIFQDKGVKVKRARSSRKLSAKKSRGAS